MHTPPPPPVLPVDHVDLIPAPAQIRRTIARKYAELTVLRRLLKAAETKAQLCPPTEGTDARP